MRWYGDDFWQTDRTLRAGHNRRRGKFPKPGSPGVRPALADGKRIIRSECDWRW